jgi:SAM-dependent methyltransferase
MQSEPVTLSEFYGGWWLDNEAAVEAAIARVPAPRSPDVLLAKLAALGVGTGDSVIDLGCGHGQYAQQIASVTGCNVVALDLSPQNVVETRAAIGEAEVARIHVARAVAEALPLRGGSAGFIWCRDMLYHVDLPRTLRECAAVLPHGGHMVVYQTFATELLEPSEAQRLYASSAIVAENMDPAYFEACVLAAGFTIVERDVIGSEWREMWEGEGGSRNTSAKLLRAARLLRGGELVRQLLGEKAYAVAVADQLWGVYQMIGKLCPTAYVLRRA